MTNADRDRVVNDAFADTIALHQRVQREGQAAISAAADALRRRSAPAGRCWSAATAAARPTRSTSPRNWSGGSPASGARGRRWRSRPTPASLTAIGNDYGFDRVFARQVEAHGQPGDVLIGISTSGGSPNVLAAVETARARGLVTIGLTGRDGGALGRAVDVHLNVPSPSTARTQEVHSTLLHVLCDLVEQELVDADA